MAEPSHVSDLDQPGWLLATPARRNRVAAALTFVFLAVGAWNIPIPGFRATYRDATRPAYEVVRLDQGWSYFSPDVGLVSPEAWVEVHHSNGETERWDFPDEFPLFDTFRRYRWIKFDEAIAFGQPISEQVLDFVERDLGAGATGAELRLVVAFSAPTEGDHGPYNPDYTAEILATRAVDE